MSVFRIISLSIEQPADVLWKNFLIPIISLYFTILAILNALSHNNLSETVFQDKSLKFQQAI